jgi:CheY-like chemotaxis protein
MTTVLVVDDDRNLLRLVAVALEAEGYFVLKAQNGIEALDLLSTASQPLVVLLDLQMPQLGGAGVLGEVTADKKLTTRNRYLLMTGYSRNLPLALANLLILRPSIRCLLGRNPLPCRPPPPVRPHLPLHLIVHLGSRATVVHAAHSRLRTSACSTSACSMTVWVAFSSLSGG